MRRTVDDFCKEVLASELRSFDNVTELCRSTFVSEHICLTKCDRCVRKHSYMRQIGNETDVFDTQ
jgi:hypothetical protein